MKVYELKPDLDHFQNLTLVKKEDTNFILNHLSGRAPIGQSWVPFRIEILRDGTEVLPPNDFPQLGSMPVFSQQAVEALGEILTANGEVLPLICGGREGCYYAYNVTREIDALDE